MQTVDILGDNRGGRAAADEFGDGTVAAVRLCVAPGVIGLEAAAPSFAPGFFRGEKIRKIDWRHLCPDPARAAEIGDPELGADAGTGEDDGLAGPFDDAGELGDLVINWHAGSLANQRATRQARGVRSLRR